MIVVVLSVTPERLRGELTRWLLEIDTGVYVGHLSARVRERLWLRIVEDVGRGRALMVWSARNEQRLAFQVHNHAWSVEDFDGLALVRRVTADSRRLTHAAELRRMTDGGSQTRTRVPRRALPGSLDDTADPKPAASPTRSTWSHAGRRRRYRNAVEQRHSGPSPPEPD